MLTQIDAHASFSCFVFYFHIEASVFSPPSFKRHDRNGSPERSVSTYKNSRDLKLFIRSLILMGVYGRVDESDLRLTRSFSLRQIICAA